MLKDEIRRRVESHYAKDPSPLLLSRLGSDMRRDSLKTEEDGKGLLELAKELAPDIDIYQDDNTKSYIVIYPSSKSHDIYEYIDARNAYRYLESLPYPIIVAFCLEARDDENVYIRINPPIRYIRANSASDSDFILVDDRYRIPGLFIEKIRSIPRDRAIKLRNNIKDWLDVYGIPMEKLQNAMLSREASLSEDAAGSRDGKSALDRLVEAQPETIVGQLVIPADIALHLSRLR